MRTARLAMRGAEGAQALAEFLALALVPFFLLLPMIAKYQDIAHAAEMAGRYVAFDATVRNEATGGWKSADQLAGEVQRSSFSNPAAPIKTRDTPGDFKTHHNLFLRDPLDNAPIANGFGTLRLDANPRKTYISIFDEAGQSFAGAARLSKKIVANSHGGPRAIPRTVRATWRSGEPYLTSEGVWTGGTVMGDYTAPVAERIPREVFDYLRQHGGALRLKLRIVDGAVLVGWDVEQYVPAEGRKPGDGDSGFHYYLAGGDFREDKVVNGKIVEPGWERIPPAASGRPGK